MMRALSFRKSAPIVHIAGEPTHGIQRCTRCGHVLQESDRWFFQVGAAIEQSETPGCRQTVPLGRAITPADLLCMAKGGGAQ